MKKLTTEKFITKSQSIYNDIYKYDKVNYTGANNHITLTCRKHGDFKITPNNHFHGKGCKECYHSKQCDSKNDFIEKAETLHNNKYDYSLVEYKNNRTKIKIICSEHGEFKQTPFNHLHNGGCSKCGDNRRFENTSSFIEKAEILHGNEYDYSLVEYKNSRSPVRIICSQHGEFSQRPSAHLQRQGCPICKESKGEKEIALFLAENNISFNRQYRFDNCRNKQPLPFDFYLLEYNICIEYNGKQHFEVVDYWGGKEGLEYRQKNDEIKNSYCKDNNINLYNIKYNDSIETCLVQIQTEQIKKGKRY